jgi:Acyl-protein synthetase, LuxE
VAENQPANKNRMTSDLSIFAARLREFIAICANEFAPGGHDFDPTLMAHADAEFNGMAMVLFALQFSHNPPYRKICEARNVSPNSLTHWTQIPAIPTAAFKELEFSCLPAGQRMAAFHSSGTTEQRPSRHFHNPESLAVYATSALAFFDLHFGRLGRPLMLTPPPAQAPHSSLVHMFEEIRRDRAMPESVFVGGLTTDKAWTLDFDTVVREMHVACENSAPLLLLGTAFSFVHLLDCLAEKNLRFKLPPGSRVLETGGYKNRSRVLPKAGLHALITERLGILPSQIICEYGMSELSSQAYDAVASGEWRVTSGADTSHHSPPVTRHFHFPPWSRVQIISPETGREVAEGETGLLRIFDLANVFSVMAIQTEDLAIRRGGGFELIGRTQFAAPRGCSLMSTNL